MARRRATSSSRSGTEGIEHRLALAGGIEAALDADALHQAGEAEAAGNNADRADDRTRVDDDLISCGGDHVAAGSREVLDRDNDPLVLLLGKIADAAEDQVRLGGGAAGRIDDQSDGRRGLVREGALERAGDAFKGQAGAKRRSAADRSRQTNHRDDRDVAAEARRDQGIQRKAHGFTSHCGRRPRPDGYRRDRRRCAGRARHPADRRCRWIREGPGAAAGACRPGCP